jgi:UDP-N-acetylglucosamine 2-epimerase
MKRFEPVIDEHGASAVLVVGDVNSTLACALVASKRHIPVVHVESGLRSNDRRMPEEINRILTDQISDVLYTTERSAHDNLAREGIAPERAVFVGNVMIDSLRASLPKAVPADVLLATPAWTPAASQAATAWSPCTGRPTSTTPTCSARSSTPCARSASACRWSSRCTRARATTSNSSACSAGSTPRAS